MAATLLRRLQPVLAMLAAVVVLLVGTPAAHADPDDEGGTKTLRAALESAARGHIDAKARLQASKKRQTRLDEGIATQQYAPDVVDRKDYYVPTGRGVEKAIGERLAKIRRILRDR